MRVLTPVRRGRGDHLPKGIVSDRRPGQSFRLVSSLKERGNTGFFQDEVLQAFKDGCESFGAV